MTAIEIHTEVDRLRADFASHDDRGIGFKHFFCPILLKDEDVELCRGHLVNQSIPNSCRKWVPQRKDIDGFYGSLLESHFSTAMNANRPSVEQILFDPHLRREIPMTITVDGNQVQYYEPTRHKGPSHPEIAFQNADGQVLSLALKVTDEVLAAAGGLQIVVDRSYVPEATASLLKSAHLTMYSMFGYRYVFSPAGLMVADILKTFYFDNVGRSRQSQTAAAKDYFAKHAGMIIPLGGYDEAILQGTIEDRRFIACIGSSGRWYALGVFVRTDRQMHVVLLPPDAADIMDTYFRLIGDMYKKEFKYQFLDFSQSTDSECAHWKGYRQEFQFEPGPSSSYGLHP